MSLLPIDLGEILLEELERGDRKNDGLLHASSHIDGPLRHTQLAVAGAPQIPRSLIDRITLMTGTLWHEYMHDTLRRLGVPYMAEVNVTPWLPDGWAGTADAVIWNPELKAFVLVDFKTQKGEGMRFIASGGAKEAHKLQTSAYWHALKKMGIPLAKQLAVWYLPKNDVRSKDTVIEPLLIDFAPLPVRTLHSNMEERRQAVEAYRQSIPFDTDVTHGVLLSDWLSKELAPIQPPEQRGYYDRNDGTYEVKLVRHWSADYCDFDSELCDCREQPGSTKIGYYDVDGTWYHRPGYEQIKPTVKPPVG